MKKSKIKLSLIEDYIKIMLANNFFNNDFDHTLSENQMILFNETKKLDAELKILFEYILNQLKLNDNSLQVLNQQLQKNNNLFNLEKQNCFSNLTNTLFMLNDELKKLKHNLKNKLNTLNFEVVI